MIAQLLILTLPFSLATLSSTCITAVDHLKPINASSIMKALESAEYSLDLSLLSEVELDGQLVEVAKLLQSKIIWDIPASKEAEIDEKVMEILPKVYAFSEFSIFTCPLENCWYGN